jgi:hypothetical protein
MFSVLHQLYGREIFKIYCLGYMVLVDDPPWQKLIAIVFFNGCILLEWEHCGTGSHEIFQTMWQLLLLILFAKSLSCSVLTIIMAQDSFFVLQPQTSNGFCFFTILLVSVKTREKKLYKKALFLSYMLRGCLIFAIRNLFCSTSSFSAVSIHI